MRPVAHQRALDPGLEQGVVAAAQRRHAGPPRLRVEQQEVDRDVGVLGGVDVERVRGPLVRQVVEPVAGTEVRASRRRPSACTASGPRPLRAVAEPDAPDAGSRIAAGRVAGHGGGVRVQLGVPVQLVQADAGEPEERVCAQRVHPRDHQVHRDFGTSGLPRAPDGLERLGHLRVDRLVEAPRAVDACSRSSPLVEHLVGLDRGRRSLHGADAQSRRDSLTARASLRDGPSWSDIAATAWMVQSAALMTVSPAPEMT